MVRAALLVLALCVAAGAGAQQPPAKPAPAKPAPAKPAPAKPVAAKPAAAKTQNRPAWAELTAEQQMILAPLKADWESLQPERRRKWIGIAKRYPAMNAKEQERVQRRMQAWAKLTPEQRRIARENYKRIAKQRTEHQQLAERWAEYQALPPHERYSHVPPPGRPPKDSK
jgi:hypothetical protein